MDPSDAYDVSSKTVDEKACDDIVGQQRATACSRAFLNKLM